MHNVQIVLWHCERLTYHATYGILCSFILQSLGVSEEYRRHEFNFPHNTAARYTTKLVETLELERAWEVGLLEITSPSSIENVSEDQCYYTIYLKPGNTYTMVRVPAGLYKRGNVLVDASDNAQREQLKNIGVITDDAPLKVSFRARFSSRMGMRLELSDDVSSLEFSPDLAGIAYWVSMPT